jgi:hypothetical protein
LRIRDFVFERRAYKRQRRGVLGIDYHSGLTLVPMTFPCHSGASPSCCLGSGVPPSSESIKLYVRPTGDNFGIKRPGALPPP